MIKVGDRLPKGSFKHVTTKGVVDLTTDEVFKGKNVAIFGLPGAYTRVCSGAHLPGYVQNADKLRACGVDTVVCVSVNDPYVMDAWGKEHKVGEKVLMLADWNAAFTRAVRMDIDLPVVGLGLRSKRYSALVVDGIVKRLYIEPDTGTHTVCSAVNMLDELMKDKA